MSLGAFHREIAILIADRVLSDAEWFGAKTSDKKERAQKQKAWAEIQKSKNWIDELVVEKVMG